MRTISVVRNEAAEPLYIIRVIHDLRAPLRSISGFGNLMLKDNDEQLDAEGKGRLQRILAAGGLTAFLQKHPDWSIA